MALTVNQGLILPDATDNANVPLTFTDFVSTAGSGMENRLVQRYASAADRTARNPVPNEGELSYLADVEQYFTFTGSGAWVPLTKGFVSELVRTSNVTFTTTETVLDFITFTAVAGVRYKLSWNGNLRSAVVNDTGRILFRWQVGGTLTTGGTLLWQTNVNIGVSGANGQQLIMPFRCVTGIPAGTASIGVTAIRDTGTGLWTSAGSATQHVYTLLEID